MALPVCRDGEVIVVETETETGYTGPCVIGPNLFSSLTRGSPPTPVLGTPPYKICRAYLFFCRGSFYLFIFG